MNANLWLKAACIVLLVCLCGKVAASGVDVRSLRHDDVEI